MSATAKIDAVPRECLAPSRYRGSADARSPRHFLHRQTVGRTKDDVRPQHMFERAIASPRDDQQTLTIFGGWKDTDGLSHARRLAHPHEFVNHPSVSVH